MCVNKTSPTAAVLGDCGQYPIKREYFKRSIKYWLKILQMHEARLVKKCYIMLKYQDELGYENWVSNIKRILQNYGFGYVWDLQYVMNERLFLSEFTQRIKDHYLQEWYSQLEASHKLYSFKFYKLTFVHERYLDILKIRKFRRAMSNFRCSCHGLNIERGRHLGVQTEDRLCTLCNMTVENEFHYMLQCERLQVVTQQYIPEKYWRNATVHNFNILMSTKKAETIINIASFIYYASQERKELLS